MAGDCLHAKCLYNRVEVAGILVTWDPNNCIEYEMCSKGHNQTSVLALGSKRIFLVIYQPKPVATGPKRPRGRPRKWVI